MTDIDWAEWHQGYEDDNSGLPLRLARVRQRVREALDDLPSGPITIISMCAGQGRDLLGVLPDHPRRDDVRARLVELDPGLAADARRAARGLPGVEVVEADAANCAAYAGLVPADLVLVCGVFGNIADEQVRHTIAHLPRLCRTGGTVFWTRHREPPDLTPTIREWFGANGFTEVAFDFGDGGYWSVGTHRLIGPSLPFDPDVRLFEFGSAKWYA